jgi:V8-like Glu-specific endopeptidase
MGLGSQYQDLMNKIKSRQVQQDLIITPASPGEIRKQYRSAILRFEDEKGDVIGTGFIASHDRNYAITCAHVIDSLGKKEGDLIALKHFDLEIELQAKVLVLCSHTNGTANYSAYQDVSILELESALPEQIRPLFLETRSDYYGITDCFCFGYPQPRRDRGTYIDKISCTDWVSRDFVELKQTDEAKEAKIERGVSGAPLCNSQGEILGMIQSVLEGTSVAYLIPTDSILKVISRYQQLNKGSEK